MLDYYMWVKMRAHTLTLLSLLLFSVISYTLAFEWLALTKMSMWVDLLDSRITQTELWFFYPVILPMLISLLLVLYSLTDRFSVGIQVRLWSWMDRLLFAQMVFVIAIGAPLSFISGILLNPFICAVSALVILITCIIRNSTHQNRVWANDALERQKRRHRNDPEPSELKMRLLMALRPHFNGPLDSLPNHMRLADLRISDTRWKHIFEAIKEEFGKDITPVLYERENITIARILNKIDS